MYTHHSVYIAACGGFAQVRQHDTSKPGMCRAQVTVNASRYATTEIGERRKWLI
jgi:hypothetical protein